MEDAADGTRTGDAQSSWVLDSVPFLEYKSCGSLLPWIYSHAPTVCAGTSAFRGRITTCKWTNSINRLFRKKNIELKMDAKGPLLSVEGSLLLHVFDRLLAGRIKVSHKLLHFPEDASELENSLNSFQVSSVVPWFMSSNCRQWSNNNNNN